MKTYFYLATNFQNLGDQCLCELLMCEVAKRSILIVDLSRCPEKFLMKLSIPEDVEVVKPSAIGRIFILSGFSRHKRIGCLLLTPGACPVYNGFFERFRFLAKNLFLRVFRNAGLKVVALGLSLPSIDSCKGAFWNAKVKLMETDFLGLRSEGLVREIRSRFGDNCSAEFCPDLAFLMSDGRKIAMRDRKSVIFSMREVEPEGARMRPEYFVSLASDLKSLGFCEFLLPTQVEEDVAFMKSVSDCLSGNEVLNRHDPMLSTYRDAFAFYETASVVFSNRLHVLLFALLSGTPAIYVGGTEPSGKVGDILVDLGVSFATLDVTTDRVLTEDIRGILREYERLESVIGKRLEERGDRCRQIICRLFETWDGDAVSEEEGPTVA